MPTERLQKILAGAGFGSRRACEDLIVDGRVEVNGRVVNRLPVLVLPERDRIRVDGKPVRTEKLVYFLLNKPRHVYCTHHDTAGRKRAVDLLVGVRERVFPVGRLDADSMGLLILTNDGELAQKLAHPRFTVPKTYRAEVTGAPTAEALVQLRQGVWLSEGRTSSARITIIHRQRTKAVLEVTLREGRNRQVRRMLAKLGHKVRRLTRIRMGKLSIARLPVGAFRPLTRAEVQYLRDLAEKALAEDRAPKARRTLRSPRKGGSGPAKAPRSRAKASSGRPPERKVGRSPTPKGKKRGRRVLLPE
ncbi:MAG: pseudouridine synthase [Phycisphaerae bacterium]